MKPSWPVASCLRVSSISLQENRLNPKWRDPERTDEKRSARASMRQTSHLNSIVYLLFKSQPITRERQMTLTQ